MHYTWLADAEYAKAYELSRQVAGDFLEDAAIEKCTVGWLEPVYYKGKPCGAIRRKSDGLHMQLLRAFKPEKYRENKLELTGPGGGAVETALTVRFVSSPEIPPDKPE